MTTLPESPLLKDELANSLYVIDDAMTKMVDVARNELDGRGQISHLRATVMAEVGMIHNRNTLKYKEIEDRRDAAELTLARLGFTYNDGSECWQAPLGKRPDFPTLDELRKDVAVRNELLLKVVAVGHEAIRLLHE